MWLSLRSFSRFRLDFFLGYLFLFNFLFLDWLRAFHFSRLNFWRSILSNIGCLALRSCDWFSFNIRCFSGTIHFKSLTFWRFWLGSSAHNFLWFLSYCLEIIESILVEVVNLSTQFRGLLSELNFSGLSSFIPFLGCHFLLICILSAILDKLCRFR